MGDFRIISEDVIVASNKASYDFLKSNYPSLSTTESVVKSQVNELLEGYVIPPEDKESMVSSIQRNGMSIRYTA